MERKHWASDFNSITDDFDTVAFDLIRLEEEETIYLGIIRYIVTDKEKQKIVGGITIETGITGADYLTVAESIRFLVDTGMFIQHVSSQGYVYSADGQQIDEVNWNAVLSMSYDNFAYSNQTIQ